MHAEQSLGKAGWLMAALFQTLIALCGILPASIGAVTAGLMYGTPLGFLICAPATLVGAITAFLLSRSLFRASISRILQRRPRLMLLDEAVARDGWRLVCLLRISPIMPFAVTSYALGLTSLKLLPYLIGTLASLPALFLYVVMGDLTRAGLASVSTGKAAPLHWALLLIAVSATLLLALRLRNMVRNVVRVASFPAERE
jgi:uncharacterized membrane protein YdjX (TVP38/TMEM64 family)